MELLGDGPNQAIGKPLGEGLAPDGGGLPHGVHQGLVLRRHRLTAEGVIDLDPVVVGGVVGGREIDSPGGAQPADDEGQLGSADYRVREPRHSEIGRHAVAGVDLAGQPPQRTRGGSQQRVTVSQKAVGSGQVLEDPNIVGDHHRQVAAARKGGPQVVAMSLNGHGHGGGIEPVGPVSDPTPATAGPEGKHLPEGVEEQVHLPGLEVSPEHLGLRKGNPARKPILQVAGCLPAPVPILADQPVNRRFEPVGHRHSLCPQRPFAGYRIHRPTRDAFPAAA